MKSKEEIKKWILKNCVNKLGNIDLTGLDFSDFDGSVFISNMIVKGSLCQRYQKVGGKLSQELQEVDGDLFQHGQIVGGSLYQMCHDVAGELLSHKLEDNDEEWDNSDSDLYVRRKVVLKPITKKRISRKKEK